MLKQSDKIDAWFLDNLVCPRDYLNLQESANLLVCPHGHKYPVVEGTPIMLLDDVKQTLHVADASLKRAEGTLIDNRAPNLYLESLGIDEEEKTGIIQLSTRNKGPVDPVVSYIVAAAGGRMYKHLIGKLNSYPIPQLRLPKGSGRALLDIGCNWGRWSIAATHKGYNVVGIDPSLGVIMAAKRVNQQLGLQIRYLVADARYLPFASNSFDNIFSYSVLQHLDKEDVRNILLEIARILKVGGTSLVQMPTKFGILCLYHQMNRFFRQPSNFEVRYWTPTALINLFSEYIGKTEIMADCYFGIGLQPSDYRFMPFTLKLVLICSALLQKISKTLPFLTYVADSCYVKSICDKETASP